MQNMRTRRDLVGPVWLSWDPEKLHILSRSHFYSSGVGRTEALFKALLYFCTPTPLRQKPLLKITHENNIFKKSLSESGEMEKYFPLSSSNVVTKLSL